MKHAQTADSLDMRVSLTTCLFLYDRSVGACFVGASDGANLRRTNIAPFRNTQTSWKTHATRRRRRVLFLNSIPLHLRLKAAVAS